MKSPGSKPIVQNGLPSLRSPKSPSSQSIEAKPATGHHRGPQRTVSCHEIRRYDETAREPLRCYCSSVEYESELVGQQDYRASSSAGVWRRLGQTLARRGTRA
jgi:hypothetical protein